MTNATDIAEKRVLIVDDSKFVRTTFNRILSSSFVVLEAVDGEAAWQTIQNDASIAMVFSDLDMPKLDGFGLLRLIRGAKDERVRKLPVIVISGSQDQGANSRARQAGANEFISKSADAPDVLSRIEEMLRSVKPNPRSEPDAAPQQAAAPVVQPVAGQPTATQQIETLQAAAQHAAPARDALTGTLTSQNLLVEGRKHFSYARRHGSPLSVMAFRVDSYADAVRDAGKDVSDQVLAHIAKMITGMLRAEDSFGRLAEASFMVVSASAGAAQINAFARRLHSQLENAQVRAGSRILKIRTSFGLATLGADTGSVEDLLKVALKRLQLAGTRTADPIVGEPDSAAASPQVAVAPPRAPQTDIERALQFLERADPKYLGEASEELVKRLLPVLSAAFDHMQLRFPTEEVLKVLASRRKEQLAA